MAERTRRRTRKSIRPHLGASRRSPPGPPSTAAYRSRRPTRTPLYPVVQHHLETFLSASDGQAASGEEVLPPWVEREFRAYLRCGILAHGFARARCSDCGHERLVAFSCKGRGVCPSCNGRRMGQVAAHLTDRVLPHLPVRQWVLSVPKRLRPYLYHRPKVATGVLHIFLRAIRSTLKAATLEPPGDARIGAVSFLHRFGSSLNVHPHYHVLVLDGVVDAASDGSARFHEAARLTPQRWEHLQGVVQRRVLRYFRRHDLLEAHVTQDMATWRASGGFSIDASVRVEGDDRAGLESLVRYCARPPFALGRLHAMDGHDSLGSPDARVLYRLPRPTPDGRSVLVLTPLELLDRLARLVPPPRRHRHRYHGVLAPNARLRAEVTAIGRPEPEEGADQDFGANEPETADGSSSRASDAAGTQPSVRIRWAALLARVFELLPLLCPACGGEMRIIAFVTHPAAIQSILLHLDLPHRPPRVAPARAPPQTTLGLDQTTAFDPAEPEPVPEYVFDQSLPEHLGD